MFIQFTRGDNMDAFVVRYTMINEKGKSVEHTEVCEGMVSVARMMMVTKPKKGYEIVEWLVTPHYSLL